MLLRVLPERLLLGLLQLTPEAEEVLSLVALERRCWLRKDL